QTGVAERIGKRVILTHPAELQKDLIQEISFIPFNVLHQVKSRTGKALQGFVLDDIFHLMRQSSKSQMVCNYPGIDAVVLRKVVVPLLETSHFPCIYDINLGFHARLIVLQFVPKIMSKMPS